jgi:nucleoside-diphosphate-sugar epimerase
VEGLERLALADPGRAELDGASGLDGIHGPVNLGNPVEMTVADIARVILRLTGSSSHIEHKLLPVDDPKVRRPDIARAQRLLDWSPQVALEEGLCNTIRYFRDTVCCG